MRHEERWQLSLGWASHVLTGPLAGRPAGLRGCGIPPPPASPPRQGLPGGLVPPDRPGYRFQDDSSASHQGPEECISLKSMYFFKVFRNTNMCRALL